MRRFPLAVTGLLLGCTREESPHRISCSWVSYVGPSLGVGLTSMTIRIAIADLRPKLLRFLGAGAALWLVGGCANLHLAAGKLENRAAQVDHESAMSHPPVILGSLKSIGRARGWGRARLGEGCSYEKSCARGLACSDSLGHTDRTSGTCEPWDVIKSRCEASGRAYGWWGVGPPDCLKKYSDAGTVCHISDECQGVCFSPGKCSAYEGQTGCFRVEYDGEIRIHCACG